MDRFVCNSYFQVSGEKSQPVQPNNQINNQLNSNVPSTSDQAPENSETGEDEHEKDESKVK